MSGMSVLNASCLPQWIAPMINYFCKFVAMTVAWWIQRFISTVQSAIKGGLLFARSLMYFISEITASVVLIFSVFFFAVVVVTVAVVVLVVHQRKPGCFFESCSLLRLLLASLSL